MKHKPESELRFFEMNSDITTNIAATTSEEIKQLKVNSARLKWEICDIIHDEIKQAIGEIITEIRRTTERRYIYFRGPFLGRQR